MRLLNLEFIPSNFDINFKFLLKLVSVCRKISNYGQDYKFNVFNISYYTYMQSVYLISYIVSLKIP